MNKRRIILLVFLVSAVALVCGASAFVREEKIWIEADGATIEETFRPDFRTRAEVVFRYGGDYKRFCESEYSGNNEECLRRLNKDFYDRLLSLCDRLEIVPVEPEATFSKEGFSYAEGIPGRKVDRERFFADAVSALSSKNVVTVCFLPVEPKNTVDDLREKTRRVSSFSTDYSTSATGRKTNVAVACDRIDGTTVLPGERFSFNETVGERAEKNGFKKAKIIVDGEFVDGIGGGVCQVSTTLFDAWMLAGLGAERAAAHSLPVSYVAPSMDAMVSSSSDLVLVNDRETPVYLRARADGNRIVVEVFGEPLSYEVKLRSVTEKILPAGYVEKYLDLDWAEEETERIVKAGKDGRISVCYRDYYDGGKLVKSEFLRRNVYKPQDGERAKRKDVKKPTEDPSAFFLLSSITPW